MKLRKPSAPPILYGAYALAGLSLIWSGYAITDLMHSGKFGLSVALAGDIGWLTVLWAEYHGYKARIHRWTINPEIVGWIIALGVAGLLVLHGHDEDSRAQMIAGPFVVLVGKAVWAHALPALRDPAALTPEQQAEIHGVIRDSEYQARLNEAQRDLAQQEADAVIERIQQEARITAARDRADFEITLDRLNMRAEIDRRTPLALTANTAEPVRELAPEPNRTSEPAHASGRPEHATTSANTDREPKSIADLAREHVAIHPTNPAATDAICLLRPNADRPSVGAAVRRARRELDGGTYR
ncbi:hypothetical protein ACFUGD_02705 [Streptomyces sp. NPDC057217]|uniref:hypothetical protein n=1 Tax=Streptomyces sp. NPDC057217 TaxID=3346054 RepID=UPI00362BE966